MRLVRRLVPFLVVAALGLTVAVAAHAASGPRAALRALQEQHFDCVWGNPLFSCVNDRVVAAICVATGVDQPGQAQWRCGGIFSRRLRLTRGAGQECWTTYVFSPWLHVMNYPTYKCGPAGYPALRRSPR